MHDKDIAEFEQRVRQATDKRAKAEILAASAPECSFLIGARQQISVWPAVQSPPVEPACAHSSSGAAFPAQGRYVGDERTSPAERSKIFMPSEHVANNGQGRSLLRVSRVAPNEWDIVGKPTDSWGKDISEALLEYRLSEYGASSPTDDQHTSQPTLKHQQQQQQHKQQRRTAARPQSARASANANPRKKKAPAERSQGLVEYKSGVELSATALWAVDVSTPDIETKSYMRNTLSSESRRRVHTNQCKRKGQPVNWPWWKQVPLQENHAIPVPEDGDDPLYSPEGLSGLERRKYQQQRRPTSLHEAQWAPPIPKAGIMPTRKSKSLGGDAGAVASECRVGRSPPTSQHSSPQPAASASPVHRRTTTVGEVLSRSSPGSSPPPTMRQFPPSASPHRGVTVAPATLSPASKPSAPHASGSVALLDHHMAATVGTRALQGEGVRGGVGGDSLLSDGALGVKPVTCSRGHRGARVDAYAQTLQDVATHQALLRSQIKSALDEVGHARRRDVSNSINRIKERVQRCQTGEPAPPEKRLPPAVLRSPKTYMYDKINKALTPTRSPTSVSPSQRSAA